MNDTICFGASWLVGDYDHSAAAEDTGSMPVDSVLSLSSLITVRDAVRAGVGAGCLMISLVNHDLADGRLVQLGGCARYCAMEALPDTATAKRASGGVARNF